MMYTDEIPMSYEWAAGTSLMTRASRTINKMAELILHDIPIAKDGGGALYYYKAGRYWEGGEKAIREGYQRMLALLGEETAWRINIQYGVIDWITTRARPILERPDLYSVNMLNGIYHWGDEVLNPHTPEYATTVQLPITFNAQAKCPVWDRFLADLLPGGEDFLREVLGLCMIPHTGLQKCIVLFGPGGTGKSTFLKALERLIGTENISNMSLHALTDPRDRFSRSGLVGKLINVYADLSLRNLADLSAFKALTGEDTIMVEYKGKNAFRYAPFARMLFSANDRVRVKEEDQDDTGFKRRIVHVPFTQKFDVNPQRAIELMDQLTSEEELSGLFNSITKLLPKLVAEGFTISEQVAEIIESYAPVPNQIEKWIKENIGEGGYNNAIPSSELYNFYLTHCPKDEPANRDRFIMYIKTIFPNVKCNVSTSLNSRIVKCYRGLVLTTDYAIKTIMEDNGLYNPDKPRPN